MWMDELNPEKSLHVGNVCSESNHFIPELYEARISKAPR